MSRFDGKEVRMETPALYIAGAFPIRRIVSGGQTGADRGALDAALRLDVSCGGWCPKGRRAEDGVIPEKHPLREAGAKDYRRRTELNVRDSDATVIFTSGAPKGGSAKTVEFAEKHGKPWLHVDLRLDEEILTVQLCSWIRRLAETPIVLNVAGSRGSNEPDIQMRVAVVMEDVLHRLCWAGWSPEWVSKPEMQTGAPALILPFAGRLAAGWPFDGFDARSLQSAEHWLRVPPEAMGAQRYVVEVDGDSMQPTLLPGEHVVVEWHRTPRRQNQLVVMCRADSGTDFAEVALKRFEETPEAWIFHSENPAYEDIPVSKADQPGHPILGIAVYNLSRGIPVR